MESAGSLLQFHRLIEQARPPQRADRAAAGRFPPALIVTAMRSPVRLAMAGGSSLLWICN